MPDLISAIEADLATRADPAHAAKAKRFNIHVKILYGVRTPIVRAFSKDYFRALPDRSWDVVLPLCEALLETGIYECRTIAWDWSFRCKRQHQPVHFEVFADWLDTHVEAWSDCDDLCTHTIGHLLWTYPMLLERLDAWTIHPNRWLRRGSAVSLIYRFRKGGSPDPVFHIADQLVHDQDDLVQKGAGWALKVAGQLYPDALFTYLEPRRLTMPRTTLRYAIEKLPRETRQLLLARD